jgi:protein-S-isoprenylcysteine O-methyltransferase Ste14
MNTDDVNFAYKVRHALDAKLDDLRPSTTDRLASARKIALARKKPDVPALVAQNALAGDGFGRALSKSFSQPFSWISRVGVVLPLLALAAGLVGIYQFEQQQHIAELAELDVAVLSDELPLSAYLDHGFNAYLTSAGQ